MIEIKNKVYSVISSFTDMGMDVQHDPDIPNITYHDLLNIANYYSVILNIGESKGALYGPLPVAYHTEYLLFLYTFTIKNVHVKDSRVIRNNNIVPSFLIIFFPTSFDGVAAKAREKIKNNIDSWTSQFSDIDDISKTDLNNLSRLIEESIIKTQTNFELSEIEEANVVIGKSINLLYSVAKYSEKEFNILICGSDEIMQEIIRKTVLESNSETVSYYKKEEHSIKIKMSNINITAVNKRSTSFNISKYINDNLTSVLYYANFSDSTEKDNSISDLEKIIKQTKENCVVSFAISQSNEPISISKTRIPDILKNATGRTISLIDLTQSKITLGTSVLEFLDKTIERIKKNTSN